MMPPIYDLGVREMLTFANRAVVPQHVLIRHLDGESVLLNLETEIYFGLDSTGTRMWELLTNSPDIETAYDELAREFEVEPAILRAQLAELLGQLVENGLLHVRPSDVENLPAL
jgi:Coenzyme PQQ synthesis protein D (PqqD)